MPSLKIEALKPSPYLKPFIIQYEWIEVGIPKEGEYFLGYPNFITGFIFLFYEDLKMLFRNDFMEDKEFPVTGLMGPLVHPVTNKRYQNLKAFRCIFAPGTINEVFNLPIVNFKNYLVELTDAFGPEIKDLHELMGEKPTKEHCKKVFEKYFTEKIRFSNEPDFYSVTIKIIQKEGFGIKMQELANQLSTSKRTLQRRMNESFGYSGNEFLNVLRICEAMKYFHQSDNINLSQTAHYFGFSDQAHFTHKFKKMTGYTPKKYLKMLGKEELFEVFDNHRFGSLIVNK